MTKFRGERIAFGHPGIEPRWARGAKDAVGTAYAASSRIWFTLWAGIITEIYYPTVDRPQTRDLQFLISDGKSFCHEEKRLKLLDTERISDHVLGYRIRNADPDGRYTIAKEIVANPHQPAVLQRVTLYGSKSTLDALDLYVLCAPHLEVGGAHNNGYVLETAGRQVLAAEKNGTWLTLAANVPFSRLSCGYVGSSDGWQDLNDNFQMDWEFDQAPDGNVALTGKLDRAGVQSFTLAIAFGDSEHAALTTLFQSLEVPYESHRRRYIAQWRRACDSLLPLEDASCDYGALYHGSYSLLMGHEDKSYPGSLIASMSIPWGEAKGDEDMGGYHLVWTRDMVNSADGLLAAGNTETARHALTYLAISQMPDGGFPQNFWLNGDPYWHGVQLDEVAFPVLLAWRLHNMGVMRGFDPYPLILGATGYLIRNGPVTQQERWEEASGYSPSTLAVTVAALICAAHIIRERGDRATARYVEEYADFLEGNLEDWTVTSQGSLVPDISRHYIRIHPVSIADPSPNEDPDNGVIRIANRGPGVESEFPAKDIVDAGFLELVRYGIRKPGDTLIEDSLAVVDAVLKVDTPFGPCWRRYNHDGYGQREDGGPYAGWGQGRAWPLLTGERGHYELAAGRPVRPFISALERFATPSGMLTEQIWDGIDHPEIFMFLGRPTGAAMPLMWAHSEYIRLLRTAHDGRVFDLIPIVAERYLRSNRRRRVLEVWKPNRQVRSVRRGQTLRVQYPRQFALHWSKDRWQTVEDTVATATAIGISYVDIPTERTDQGDIQFTFLWADSGRWEGRDWTVRII